jgi:peroxiredoxin
MVASSNAKRFRIVVVLLGAASIGALAWSGSFVLASANSGAPAAAVSTPPASGQVADSGCPAANLDATALSSIGIGNQVGQVAPDFTLPDFAGKPVTLSTFRGCLVILDFWASWCKPCLTTMPKIEALRERHQARGLKVVAVSLDYRLEDAARYLAANGFDDFLALWGSFAQARTVARAYGVHAIPRAVLIDRQGIIRFIGHPQGLTEDIISPWL